MKLVAKNLNSTSINSLFTIPHLTLDSVHLPLQKRPPHYAGTYFFLTSFGLCAQGANRGNDRASLAICDRKKCNYLFPLEEKGSCENVT